MAWDSDVIVFSIILVFLSSVKAQPDIADPDSWRDHNHRVSTWSTDSFGL